MTIDRELRKKIKKFPGLAIPDDEERVKSLMVLNEQDKTVATDLMGEVGVACVGGGVGSSFFCLHYN